LWLNKTWPKDLIKKIDPFTITVVLHSCRTFWEWKIVTPWTHLIVLQHRFTGNGIITNVRDECRTAVIVKGSKPVNMKKKKFLKSYIINKIYKLFHSIFLRSKIRKLVLNYSHWWLTAHSNIFVTDISWRFVVLMEEKEISVENHRAVKIKLLT
jgi:hypothetical protein